LKKFKLVVCITCFFTLNNILYSQVNYQSRIDNFKKKVTRLNLGKAVGFAHTHGEESGDNYLDNQLINSDVNTAIGFRFPVYGGFPNGTASKFDPHSGATSENFNTSPLPYDTNAYDGPAGSYFDCSHYNEID